ncbi:Helix-turn-helix domain-containing protein [Epilithonimonas bovis DSM 19482]|uniref:Helix-turn-helix domain-containing protein n=1 Tax=Epilithonimonas bovis DSM 19482 TaxID=1121284 RepID=A0A1U7PWF8_9FLAO|nr:helix-turn-helix domain-containing protein [Epilithonimonas bovis]MDN5627213.1 helix-turn-helix domain-containing protein [Weeksellaceae bacterium]SIT96151.1 Helix-turn-helix domain-containing protein [Epilithonimonas bovis DSM 19482]
MEVITIESQAYKNLMSKVDTIFDYVVSQQNTNDDEDSWVDSYEVCTFLKISDRTLQRLRSDNKINYSRIRGKNYYRISEIKRMLQENLIRRSEENLQDLILNHQKNVRQKQSAELHP